MFDVTGFWLSNSIIFLFLFLFLSATEHIFSLKSYKEHTHRYIGIQRPLLLSFSLRPDWCSDSLPRALHARPLHSLEGVRQGSREKHSKEGASVSRDTEAWKNGAHSGNCKWFDRMEYNICEGTEKGGSKEPSWRSKKETNNEGKALYTWLNYLGLTQKAMENFKRNISRAMT